MRPKVKPKYRAEAARAVIERKHASKVKFLTGKDFRTRIHGTEKQIGQKFPVSSASAKRLPKLTFKKPTASQKVRLSSLEIEAQKEEQKLLAAGFKGWMISVRYKDGSTEDIPIIAKTYQGALKKAKPKMNQVASQIDEIVIIDPSIGEILHKVGAGAVGVAKKIGKGIMLFPARVEKLGLKAARKLGRIAAQPAQMREAFSAAKKERPWLTPEQFAAETGMTRLKEAEVGASQISAPGTQYRPSERELLSAETAETLRREARRREARDAVEAKGIRLQRMRVNGRSWKPFGVPLLEYQSGGSAAPATESQAYSSRVEQARRRAAWEERAPVTIER